MLRMVMNVSLFMTDKPGEQTVSDVSRLSDSEREK